MRQPSTMQHNFANVPRAEIQRSSFDRSHNLKTTFDGGYLIPIFWDEALPGDTFNCRLTAFCRLATPLHPIMDNMRLTTFFFAVPYRLVQDNFVRLMGEQPNPGDSTDFLLPVMTSPVGGYANGSIYDYFGLPTGIAGFSHSSLWLRAYNLIWNEWFRDQNLQNRVTVLKGDTADPVATYALLRRGKRHDYFTSGLPWPQKGPAATIPLGTSAPVTVGAEHAPTTGNANALLMRYTTGGGFPGAQNVLGVNTIGQVQGGSGALTSPSAMYPTNLIADLSSATAATINSLRQAFAIQQLYERDARGGTRYIETILSHFNVMSPDARLQRPEYLGGGVTPIDLYAVPQTSAADSEPTPQGNLAAYGTVTAQGHGFTKSFTEHTILIGLAQVSADLNYQQGLDRMWSRRTRFDMFWPSLAHIGEQTVLNKEIYTQGTAADDLVFAYQERFAEYRHKRSCITGQMRSTFAQSLDTWHLAQEFSALPLLNAAFIEDNPPIDRVVAVTTEPDFIGDLYFRLRCARPMPVYGVPGMSRL